MLEKTHISLINELGAICKCIGKYGLANLMRLETELNKEMSRETGQRLGFRIVSSAYISGFSPPTAEDPVLESRICKKREGYRTFQRVVASMSFHEKN